MWLQLCHNLGEGLTSDRLTVYIYIMWNEYSSQDFEEVNLASIEEGMTVRQLYPTVALFTKCMSHSRVTIMRMSSCQVTPRPP